MMQLLEELKQYIRCHRPDDVVVYVNGREWRCHSLDDLVEYIESSHSEIHRWRVDRMLKPVTAQSICSPDFTDVGVPEFMLVLTIELGAPRRNCVDMAARHPITFMGGYGPRIPPGFPSYVPEPIRFSNMVCQVTPPDRNEIGDNSLITAFYLLYDNLTAEEQDEFLAFGTITIKTDIGMFRIYTQQPPISWYGPPTYNVYYNGNIYCLSIKTDALTAYPYYDHILAQVITIKKDPNQFLQTANKLIE